MRCNVGVNPKYLADQHLIAEYRELPMVIGSLRINGWKIKTPVGPYFSLGKGHINWFKPRLAYLRDRHEAVKVEMGNRGFKHDALEIKYDHVLNHLWNNWKPTIEDSEPVRNRIFNKIFHNYTPFYWWRYNGKPLTLESAVELVKQIQEGELFYV
jgi:deoxyribonuclease (pyrimidine dimer)